MIFVLAILFGGLEDNMYYNDFYSPYFPIMDTYESLKKRIKDFEDAHNYNINAQIIEYRKYGFKDNKEFRENYIGKVFSSNTSGLFKVIEYLNYDKILVEFINSGYRVFSRANNIKKGELKDPYYPSVLGKGYLGLGPFGTNNSIFDNMVYSRWRELMRRVYQYNEGKSMDTEWHNYQHFSAWMRSEFYLVPGAKLNDMCIDKDILIPGNMKYGPGRCLILPDEINNRIQIKDYRKDRIRRVTELNEYELNRLEYQKSYREKIVHEMAEKYKWVIPYHVYCALRDYKMY